MQYRLKTISRTLAIMVVIIGIVVLYGWIFNIPILKSIVPSFVSMKPNSAVNFVFSGLALWFINSRGQPSFLRKISSIFFSSLTLLIGLLTLIEYVFIIDLHIDQLLFKEDPFIISSFPGRMAPVSAFSFSIIGIGLFIQIFKAEYYKITQLISFLIFTIALLGFSGYLYGAEIIYSRYFETTIALPTTLAFLIYSVALLNSPGEKGIISIFTSNTLGGSIARWGVPLVVIIPLFLGWLRLKGEHLGLYDTEFGLLLISNVTILIFIAIILWNGLRLMKLEKKEEQSRLSSSILLNTVSQSVIATDLKGEINYWNSAAEKIYGWKSNQVIGHNAKRFTSPILPEKTEKEIIQKLNEGEKWEGELVVKHKDGTVFPVEVYNSPIIDSKGKTSGVVSLSMNITERKKTEAKLKDANAKLEIEIKEKEKKAEALIVINDELKQFVYIASHDLQEPLRTISNFISLIDEKHRKTLDNETSQYFTFILAATSKMQSLIKDLLDYSRVGRKTIREDVDCNNILEDVLNDMDASIKENHAKIISEELPVINGNYREIKQLFQNIISNAVKFRKKDVLPVINITVEEKANEFLFAISDNGIGIKEQNLDKLFVVFQRLNSSDEYQGTGIGLAICRKIVNQHQGKIWIESEFGEGSVIYFSLHK